MEDINIIGRRRTDPVVEGMRCPITNELLYKTDEDFIYRADGSNKRWVYLPQYHVFEEVKRFKPSTYKWSDDKWQRVCVKYYNSSFGSSVYVNTTYVSYPKTNWEAICLELHNFMYTNKFTIGVIRLFRKFFPKNIGFPIVRNVSARTIASELISVQLMSGPTSMIFAYDIVASPGFSNETKAEEHVIIENQPKD